MSGRARAGRPAARARGGRGAGCGAVHAAARGRRSLAPRTASRERDAVT